MEGIDKARLLSGLLRAKGRYKRARSPTRPFIAYEISLLRQRLGMGTGLPEDVLERVQNNPVDMSKTLTPEEYTKQVQTWMPHSFVSLEGMNAENTKGAVKALQDVILRYPKIADHRVLMTFSTSLAFEKMADFNKKHLQDRLKEYVERYHLLEKVPDTYIDNIRRAEEESFGLFPPSSHLSYGEAMAFARRFKLQDHPRVIKSLRKVQIIREEFANACMEAIRESWATWQATIKILGESPDLSRWLRAKKELRLKRAESKGVLALHFANVKIGGALLLSAFGTERLQRSYSRDVLTEFHPRGTDSGEPYGAGEAVVMHELGHALDVMLDISTSAEFKNLRYGELASVDFAKDVSRYAAVNNKELIAEAFCEYKLSKAPRPVAMAIGRIIDEAYDKKFGELK